MDPNKRQPDDEQRQSQQPQQPQQPPTSQPSQPPQPLQPQQSQQHLQLPQTTGPAASTGNLAPTASNTLNPDPIPSPSPSRRSVQPSTPFSEGEGGTEYFPALDIPPSLLSPPSHTGTAIRAHSNSNVSSAADDPTLRPAHQPSIRIRRRSSTSRSNRPRSARDSSVPRPSSSHSNRSNRSNVGESSFAGPSASRESSTRRPRSVSQPERAHVPNDAANRARHSRRVPQVAMPRLTEEGARPTMEELGMDNGPPSPAQSLPDARLSLSRTRTEPGPSNDPSRMPRMRKMSRFFWPRRQTTHPDGDGTELEQQATLDEAATRADEEYNERLVDYLDTIDPEVQTLSTLTNVQNSLFVPDLGKWINRRPTYNLTDHDIEEQIPRPSTRPGAEQMGEIPEERHEEAAADAGVPADQRPRLERTSTITSRLTESHYAALPHGTTLEGWTAEEKWELDDHVRHMLHSRRSKFKQKMKGFGQYVRRPLGFFVTLYATLITLFGLAWVLFLIGWIYVGDRQVYVIHIIDSVLVALFAIMGDGLAPFRAIDTYHMAFVLHYANKVKKDLKKRELREKERAELPAEAQQNILAAENASAAGPPPEGDANLELESPASNDPHTMRNNIVDNEDTKSGIGAYEDTPLTPAQQKSLHHHQTKLAKSHSFYKPHETPTHYAFPLKYLIAIVILLDCHSCLQISLGATTWGIDYHTRPFAITTVILCVSITCNITAGVIISIGDRKTRKQDVWKLMARQELTEDAMRAIEQKRSNSHKADKTGESDLDTEKGQSKEAVDLSTASLISKDKENEGVVLGDVDRVVGKDKEKDVMV